jgi:anti-anti-sigma factor
MPSSLTLDTARPGDGILVLIATGEIDLSNVDTFRQALIAATTESADSGARLILDLTAVEYVDSAAINAVSVRSQHIQNVIVHPLLMTTFTVSGLAELVTVDPARPGVEH